MTQILIKHSPHVEVLLFLGLKKDAFVAIFDLADLQNDTDLKFCFEACDYTKGLLKLKPTHLVDNK